VLDERSGANLSTALVTLCIGIGMGTATIIEAGVTAIAEDSIIAKIPVDTVHVSRAVWKPIVGRNASASATARGPQNQFGVNLVTLKPGACRPQRHWQ